MSNLPPFSSLASKPAQPPSTTRPLPLRSPSSNNYASALAASQAASTQSPITTNTENTSTTDPTSPAAGESKTPISASWRPNFNRTMSWNHQDMRHMRQEGLMSPTEGKVLGFTSKDAEENARPGERDGDKGKEVTS